METPRTEKIMSTGEKQAFEGMFQIKIPEGPSTTDSLQQLLIASMMSLKSDTTKTNTDLERIGGEVEEVKDNVRKIEDKTEELERRLKLLEQNQPGGHKRPADEALAVEDAKKIVVFWPIEGYTRDRKAMERKMQEVYTMFDFDEDLKEKLRGARFFQTNDGKANDSVHVEHESPYLSVHC